MRSAHLRFGTISSSSVPELKLRLMSKCSRKSGLGSVTPGLDSEPTSVLSHCGLAFRPFQTCKPECPRTWDAKSLSRHVTFTSTHTTFLIPPDEPLTSLSVSRSKLRIGWLELMLFGAETRLFG